MAQVLISVGANLGDRQATLSLANDRLALHSQIAVLAYSQSYQTAPIGGPGGQGAFLNAAALLETSLSPDALLTVLHEIENELGRERNEHWAARTLDLDLLLYDDQEINTPSLVVPHPRMSFRRFVLDPAVEVAPEMVHPGIGWTVAELHRHLHESVPYVALAGPIGVGKTFLARQLSKELDLRLVEEAVPSDRLSSFYADPTGRAWETEIEFLKERTSQLDAQAWTDGSRPTISDFWFDQSLAFAQLWLDERAFEEFFEAWRTVQPRVVRPRLLVVLDAPAKELVRAIDQRGRPYEQSLGETTLEQLRASLDNLIRPGGHGPVLRLTTNEHAAVKREVSAAVQAMQAS